MGDRVEKSRLLRGPRPQWEKTRTPDSIRNWGLTSGAAPPQAPLAAEVAPRLAATIGDNNSPPLQGEDIEGEDNDAIVRYLWQAAHAGAWKNPPMEIMKFRVARAEAAGVSYREYMLALLDSGRHLQAGDVTHEPKDVGAKDVRAKDGERELAGDKLAD